jgi:hypothetical protein
MGPETQSGVNRTGALRERGFNFNPRTRVQLQPANPRPRPAHVQIIFHVILL